MARLEVRAWLYQRARRYWRPILALLALQAATGLLISAQPTYFQRIVSLALGDARGELFFEKGLPLMGILLATFLGVTLLQGVAGYIGCVFSSSVLRDLQADFFRKVNQLPLSFFHGHSSGEFFTKFNNDVGQAQRFLSDVLPSMMREAVTLVAVTTILFYVSSASLTLVALAIVATTTVLVLRLNRALGRYARAQRENWGEINSLFEETVEGIETLKTFAGESRRAERFMGLTSRFRNLSVRAGTIAAVFSPGIELAGRIGGLGLIVLAYHQISTERIGPEAFLLFFFYSALLQASSSSLVRILSGIQPQIVGIRTLASFFDQAPEEEPDRASTGRGAHLDHSVSIELAGVHFAYPGSRPLYVDANLEIPACGTTMIYGPSGSGKSTLINLLLRFEQPAAGEIHYGDTRIDRLSRKELRRQVGVVAQQHFIFSDTLRENLAIAKPDATDREIAQALKQAQLDDLVARHDEGMNQILNPRGRGLSGGERQRICVARLLLRKTPVMILDEPWSNLDLEARDRLAAVVNSISSTTTIIVLSHQWFPALRLERLYRLDSGRGVFVEEEARPMSA